MNNGNSSSDRYLLLQFRSGLREQQREVLNTIKTAEKKIQDFSVPVPDDPIDFSGFTASKESLLANTSRDRSRLLLIELALTRINDGRFGICADCNGPIGLKRLQALPWASHCIRCQEQADVTRLAGSQNLDVTHRDDTRDSGT